MPTKTDGENGAVGSTYNANLTERVNKANTRNKGPSRGTSNVGKLSDTSQGSRKTGKVG